MALSITEAKYMAMVVVEAGKEFIWMKNFLNKLGINHKRFLLHYDNQSAINLGKNDAYHSQTKHI